MRMLFRKVKAMRGSGSRQVYDFLNAVEDGFAKRVMRFVDHRLADEGYFEQAFYYGEQQTKSFLTAAIDEVCDSDFMQERKVKRDKGRRGRGRSIGRGKVDYWCRYGLNAKTTVLMEAKQDWIRWCPNKEDCTVYSSAVEHHQEAVQQVGSVFGKMEHTTGNLYGVALTVLPIFVRYDSADDPQVTLRSRQLAAVAEKAREKLNGHAVGVFAMPRAAAVTVEFDSGTVESNPGVVLVWSVFKFSRK